MRRSDWVVALIILGAVAAWIALQHRPALECVKGGASNVMWHGACD